MRILGVFSLCSLSLAGQALDPALLNKPLANDWPTYSGDYSGQRYSRLTQINQSVTVQVGGATEGAAKRHFDVGGG